MKNINKYFKIIALKTIFVLLYVSCDTGLDLAEELGGSVQGVSPEFTIDPDASFFNFFDPNSARIAFSVDVFGEAQSIAITVLYTNIDGDTLNAVPLSITEFPTDFEFTLMEMASFVGADFNAINPADQFTFVVDSVTNAEGRTFSSFNAGLLTTPDGFGGDFVNPFPVVCPSDLEGTYDGTVAGFGSVLTGEVEVTQVGDFSYELSDISVGLLGALTSQPDRVVGGNFDDLCETVVVNTFAPPGLVDVSQDPGNFGSVDPQTGIITINWSIVNTSVTTTLVPQP